MLRNILNFPTIAAHRAAPGQRQYRPASQNTLTLLIAPFADPSCACHFYGKYMYVRLKIQTVVRRLNDHPKAFALVKSFPIVVELCMATLKVSRAFDINI